MNFRELLIVLHLAAAGLPFVAPEPAHDGLIELNEVHRDGNCVLSQVIFRADRPIEDGTLEVLAWRFNDMRFTLWEVEGVGILKWKENGVPYQFVGPLVRTETDHDPEMRQRDLLPECHRLGLRGDRDAAVEAP